MAPTVDLPVFALNLVALPGELIPLHIFEDRYKAMVEACLENESEFVIVYADERGVQTIGCAVAIADVLERMDDGRLNIVCRGTRPVRLLADVETHPYPAAQIEPLADEAEDPDEEVIREAHVQYAELVERATDDEPSQDDLDSLTAFGMAARIDFSAEAKQGLLNLRSENARIDLLARLLRATNKRLEMSELVAERARMNGKVRFD